MKSRGGIITLIILLSIIVVILISIMVLALINRNSDFKVSFFSFGDKTKLISQNEYDINGLEYIYIEASSSNVKFIEGSSDKVKVTIYGGENEKFNVNLTDNRLDIIKDNSTFHVFVFFAWYREEIIVEIPKMYDGDIGIKLSSGNVEMIDLDKSNVDIECSSGNVKCGNIYNGSIRTSSGNIFVGNGNELNLKASSGNIKVGNVVKATSETSSGGIQLESGDDVQLRATSGSIKVGNINRITAKTSSGSIKINSVNGYLDLSSTSGGIKIEECSLTENSNIHATSGSVSVNKTNDIYIDASSTSGSRKVNNGDRKSDTELKISTTSGSIKVNE